jgi:NAD-specific glutamate dehydrogenase
VFKDWDDTSLFESMFYSVEQLILKNNYSGFKKISGTTLSLN